LRQVCVFLDLRLVNKPEVFSQAGGPSYSEDGDLLDEKIQGNVKLLLETLKALTLKLKN